MLDYISGSQKKTVLKNSREAFEMFYEILVTVLASVYNKNRYKKKRKPGARVTCFCAFFTMTSTLYFINWLMD